MATEIEVIEKSEIDQFRVGGSSSIAEAKRLAAGIVDATTLDAAAKFMLEAKSRGRKIVERLRTPKQDAQRAWKNWCDLEHELVEPYERIEKEIIKPAMAQFQFEEDRKRRQEEDRLRAEAKKREEDERLREAQTLVDDGQAELADTLLESEVVVAPITLPRTEIPSGITYRDAWRFEIVNPDLIPRDYLEVDEKKIGGVVRALKGETKIPGVRVYSEKIVAGRI